MIRFVALPTEIADAYRSGTFDANGQPPERRIADTSGLPCRHCLGEVAPGDEYLAVGHRPFSNLQPFAEVGPIYLHADQCQRYPEISDPPAGFLEETQMMMRGYNKDQRIVYGTGAIVPTQLLRSAASAIFENPEVSFIHVRSAKNGCFQCRIDTDVEQG